MNVPAGFTRLAGSERAAAPGAVRTGPADPGETLSVTILVRRRPDAPPLPDPGAADVSAAGTYEPAMSREQFAASYGAAPEDLERVATFARAHGLEVVETSAASRTVVAKGTVAQMSAAFGVELSRYATDGGSYRGREGALHVPADLDGVVEGVFGLDDRPMARRAGPPLA